eukprot:3056926-Amphidinium_carterae.1
MSLGVSEGGQHETMDFDATKGFPGEGPLPTAGKRECADLKTTVQPSIERRYSLRVHGLELWLQSQGHPNLVTLKLQHEVVVHVLKEYVGFLYTSMRPVTWGTDLLAGVQYYHPDVIGKIGEVWAMQRHWQRLQPGQFRVPMPLAVLLSFVLLSWHWGWHRVSTSLLLGYHLMLRPSELTNALRQHLVLPCDLAGDMGSGVSGVLCVPKSKTSDRASRLQSIVIEDALVLRMALAVFGPDPPRVPLLSGGMRAFLIKFNQLKCALGLECSQFNPSSLRGGGATEYIRRTGNLGYLQLRGRWLSPKSMHHYLQMGLSATAYAAREDSTKQVLQTLAAVLPLRLLIVFHTPHTASSTRQFILGL